VPVPGRLTPYELLAAWPVSRSVGKRRGCRTKTTRAWAHGPEDLVFTMPQGGPLREAKFLERYVKPAAAAADLPATLRA
jgi:hypothetical protein